MINSHGQGIIGPDHDTSKRATLRASLQERLVELKKHGGHSSSETATRFDTDWGPFEIEQAIATYGIPIIAAYPGYEYIMAPAQLRVLWPAALASRIANQTARVIHIPFKKEPISDAISQFDHDNPPNTSLSYYKQEVYIGWGLLKLQS